MKFQSQKIIPAARNMKSFEELLRSSYEYIILLETHVAQLKSMGVLARKHQKKLFVHIDLIQGLQSDKYGVEFVCQECKPYGILSTKTNAIIRAKEKGIVTVQRFFLLDSHSFQKSCMILEKTKPDYMEVLPGALVHIIKKLKKEMDTPIMAGGFIQTVWEVETLLEAGIEAVTTSDSDLWSYYEKKISQCVDSGYKEG